MKPRGSPSALGASVTSTSGSPIGTTPDSNTACWYHSGRRVLEGLLEDRSEAEALDDQRRWRLALAEAGQAHFAGEAAGSALDLDADVFGRNLGLDPGTGILKFCNGGLQGRLTLAIQRAGSAFAPFTPEHPHRSGELDQEAGQAPDRTGHQPRPERCPPNRRYGRPRPRGR